MGRLAVEDIGGVGDANGHFVPDSVSGNEGKGASRVMLRTTVASQCFLFKSHLEIGSRVVGERD